MNEHERMFMQYFLDKFGLDPNRVKEKLEEVVSAIASTHQQTSIQIGELKMALVKVQEEDLVALKTLAEESNAKVDAVAASLTEIDGDISELQAKIDELLSEAESPLAAEVKTMAEALKVKIESVGAAASAVAAKVPEPVVVEPAPEPEPPVVE
jgi:chromosome segregation ATPase